MASDTVQIGSFIFSKSILDVLSPLFGTLIGGLITYFVARSIENRKWENEKKDRLSERKREALAQALGEFPADHDLKRLFRRLHKKGVRLSNQNREWLSYLNRCNELRYPDPGTGPDVDVNHWTRTEALFEELRRHIPEEIQKQIVLNERYRSNVKSGKTIWPEIKKPSNPTGGDSQ